MTDWFRCPICSEVHVPHCGEAFRATSFTEDEYEFVLRELIRTQRHIFWLEIEVIGLSIGLAFLGLAVLAR